MKTLEQDLLKELLNYDPDTGIFTWVVDRGGIKSGAVAGCVVANGYTQIMINRKSYFTHRLAWIYTYGYIPEGLTIDHINGVRADSSIKNLRLASRAQQNQNIKISVRNTSGYVGVIWKIRRNKWLAYITVNKKQIDLGFFDTPEAANDARIKAKAELHTFNPIQRTS